MKNEEKRKSDDINPSENLPYFDADFSTLILDTSHIVDAFDNMTNLVNHVSDIVSSSHSSVIQQLADTSSVYKNLPISSWQFIETLELAAKTQELSNLVDQISKNLKLPILDLSAIITDYTRSLSSQWIDVSSSLDIIERSIPAQDLAILRVYGDFENLNLPWGGKKVLRGLTQKSAKHLTKINNILFDTKERNFFIKDNPGQTLSADQITVAESSLGLFEGITLDEILSFESILFSNMTFATSHPVGKKILDIIKNWTKFIDFDDTVYYHARKLKDSENYFLDQEMLRAPENVSAHGRYNEIGRSCYYVATTRDGAINEIVKHGGGTKQRIQVVGVKPKRSAKIIDLSGEVKETNIFINHLRFTVDIAKGIIVKEYLLPNYVAACCKELGIDGIKYKCSDYFCYVLWRDDYFNFAPGSRCIVEK